MPPAPPRSVQAAWLALIAGVLLGGGVPAIVVATSPLPSPSDPLPIALPQRMVDVSIGDGGEVRVTTGTGFRDRATATVRRVDPAGLATPPTTLARPGTGYRSASPQFTPDGVLIPFNFAKAGHRSSSLRVFSVRPDGTRTSAQDLSTPGTSWTQDSLAVGPNGAVALSYIEHRPGRRSKLRLRLRPAGADRFRRATDVLPLAAAPDTQVQTLLGPDGGGVVIVRPNKYVAGEPYLRRLSPTGVLGPKLRLRAPMGKNPVLAAAFGPSGTLVLALLTEGPPYPDAKSPGQLMTATLPAGAAAMSAFRRVDRGSASAAGDDNLSVVVGPGDHTVLLAGSDVNTDEIRGEDSDVVAQRIYEGTGADVRLVDRLTAYYAQDGHIALAPDGAVTAIWSEHLTQSAQGDHLTAGIFGARRAPGGSFGAPRLLSPPSPFDGDAIDAVQQLTDGRVGVVYRRFGEGNDPGRLYVLLTKP